MIERISSLVATALTVYGIETKRSSSSCIRAIESVATALTVYGIETQTVSFDLSKDCIVATALTVYGIETEQEVKLCTEIF